MPSLPFWNKLLSVNDATIKKFKDKSVVVTGTFESMTRATITDVIERAGGKLLKGVTGQTDFLLVGADPGLFPFSLVVQKENTLQPNIFLHKSFRKDETGEGQRIFCTSTLKWKTVFGHFGPSKTSEGNRRWSSWTWIRLSTLCLIFRFYDWPYLVQILGLQMENELHKIDTQVSHHGCSYLASLPALYERTKDFSQVWCWDDCVWPLTHNNQTWEFCWNTSVIHNLYSWRSGASLCKYCSRCSSASCSMDDEHLKIAIGKGNMDYETFKESYLITLRRELGQEGIQFTPEGLHLFFDWFCNTNTNRRGRGDRTTNSGQISRIPITKFYIWDMFGVFPKYTSQEDDLWSQDVRWLSQSCWEMFLLLRSTQSRQ